MKHNKLIAEFMQSIEDGLYLDGLYFHKGRYYDTNMEFHKSWDWLMDVVDKIEDMGCEMVTTNGKCTISGANDCYVESIGKNRRGATYDAVVEFINQFNK